MRASPSSPARPDLEGVAHLCNASWAVDTFHAPGGRVVTQDRFTRGRCGFCGALASAGGADCRVCGRPLDGRAPATVPAVPVAPSGLSEVPRSPSGVVAPPSQPPSVTPPTRGIRGWIERHRGKAWFDFARVVLAVTVVGVTFGGLRVSADRESSDGLFDGEPVRSASPRARRATSTPTSTPTQTPTPTATPSATGTPN